MESVEKDVIRTYPDVPFFDGKAQEAIKSILFVYAKLNPGVSYVQGMNGNILSNRIVTFIRYSFILSPFRIGGNSILCLS